MPEQRQTKTSRAPTPWMGNRAALALAEAILAAPVAKSFIVRPPVPSGPLLWRCVLPLTYCKPSNNMKRTNRWKSAADLKRCYEKMLEQHGYQPRSKVLPGRPVVHCIRFASAPIDIRSDWAKDPLDCLIRESVQRLKNGSTRVRKGLGFLVDDRQACADIHAWWEPAPPRKGFCLIQVFAPE